MKIEGQLEIIGRLESLYFEIEQKRDLHIHLAKGEEILGDPYRETNYLSIGNGLKIAMDIIKGMIRNHSHPA